MFTQWQVLISTDVLSRGIDVPAVTLARTQIWISRSLWLDMLICSSSDCFSMYSKVVNYELPMSYSSYGQPDYETYMHRIGRTGRHW